MKETVSLLKVVEVRPNPKNPRKRFDKDKLTELAASIKAQGLIQPITVRPVKDGYEIVCGHRRFLAVQEIGMKEIPAIVRQMDDRAAADALMIENLHREDLTPLEEARAFVLYVNGAANDVVVREERIAEICQRTGIAPKYIRGRMEAMSLPAKVLEAWDKEILTFGHIEQLLRVKSQPKVLAEMAGYALPQSRKDGRMPLSELKRRIDNLAVALKEAPFKDERCAKCVKNSDVQQSLFSIPEQFGGVAACMDPGCFRERLRDWYKKNWGTSRIKSKTKTNGFVFSDEVEWNTYHIMFGGVTPKCYGCAKFVTLLRPDGDVQQDRVCVGKFDACSRDQKKKTGPSTDAAKPARKPGEPRVPWHGSYFRDLYFREWIPQAIKGLDPNGDKMKVLKLIALMKKDYGVMRKVAELSEYCKGAVGWVDDKKVIAHLLSLPIAKISSLYAAAAEVVIMDGGSRGGGFGVDERRQVADFLGVNLKRDWSITEEYIKKKTTAELMEICEEQKIFDDKKFKDYMVRKFKKDSPKTFKKAEISDAILNSGIKLIGRATKEILA